MTESPIFDELINGTTEDTMTETDPTTPPPADAPAIAAGLRTMIDSAYPVAADRGQPVRDIVLLYAGGDTPHPWTPAEIASMPERYRWPCWVRSNPESHDPGVDAAMFINWLRAHHVPQNTAVILDLETAVNGPFVNAFNQLLRLAGWKVTKYGSQNSIWQNPKTDGGTFLALPGNPELTGEGDEVARQYAFDGTYDLSVVLPSVPLWDTRAHHGPFRHVADGTKSLSQVADERGTSVAHIVEVTRHSPISAHNLAEFERYRSALMPKGLVYYTTHP